MDRKKNNSGFELIDICKNLNLTILNGRFGQDKNKGAMTFRNISVIDYAIVSVKCFDLLKDFQIKGLDRIYSDGHSFLLLNIKTKSKPSTVQTQKPTTDRSYLNKKDYQRFVQNFDYTKMEILLNKMQMTDHASPAEVNGYVAEITDAFQAAATQINTNKSSKKLNQDNNHKPWFGKECKTARRNYHLAKRIHHNIKSDENRANLLEASKHYKKTMNKFINKYTKSKCNKLRHMSTHEPKSYWKFLNSLNKKKAHRGPTCKRIF